jgi:hypothetical protein
MSETAAALRIVRRRLKAVVRDWLAAKALLTFLRLASPDLFNDTMQQMRSPLRMPDRDPDLWQSRNQCS